MHELVSLVSAFRRKADICRFNTPQQDLFLARCKWSCHVCVVILAEKTTNMKMYIFQMLRQDVEVLDSSVRAAPDYLHLQCIPKTHPLSLPMVFPARFEIETVTMEITATQPARHVQNPLASHRDRLEIHVCTCAAHVIGFGFDPQQTLVPMSKPRDLNERVVAWLENVETLPVHVDQVGIATSFCVRGPLLLGLL